MSVDQRGGSLTPQPSKPAATTTTAATVHDVIAAVQRHYPEGLAESWDAVGLAVGSRSAPVAAVHYTVDVTTEVVREAVAGGADLIVAHHPLFLRPVHAVDLDTPKGRIVAELIRHDVALYVAHTNADLPPDGTVHALATALGLLGQRPLRPTTSGVDGAESGVWTVADPAARGGVGLGRVGSLPQPLPLTEFVERVVGVLPRSGAGIRVSGDPDRPASRVAVQAGAGDDLLDEARAAGADVYLTSDLRHHPASEARAWPDAPALVDVPHWAAESLWLPVVQRLVAAHLGEQGLHITSTVSEICTDPWTASW